ncbi:Ig-like domain-containing protein [Pseudoalteromonas maricaloris]|uniref:Ig-like domain-containing protein n=1 Tax=Pseudoalteromonas maricaloris TaxID=184924 RepID=UPI003C1CC303
MKRSIISTIIASALLSACGGSSDNNDNDVIGGQGNFTVETSTAFTTQEDTTYTLAVSPKSAPSGNDTLTVEVIKSPTLGTLTSSGLSLSYQPAPNKNGTDSFTYKFKKGGVLSNEVTVDITVEAINDAPTISGAPSPEAIKLNDSYHFTPTVEDVDGETSTYQFKITNKPSWAEFDTTTGELSGKPANIEQLGNYRQIVISVLDGEHSVSLPPFDIEVVSQPWQAFSELPNDLGSHLQSAALGKKIIIASHAASLSSSMSCANAPLSAPEIHSLATTNTDWQALPSANESRYYYQAQVSNNKLFLFGGTEACPSTSSPRETMEIFDFSTQQWTSIAAPKFAPFENNVLASCANDDTIVAFTQQANTTYAYQLATADTTWSHKPASLPNLSITDCQFIGNELFITANNTQEQQAHLIQYQLSSAQILLNEQVPAELFGNYYTLTHNQQNIQLHSAANVLNYDTQTMQWSNLASNPSATEQQGSETYYLRDFKMESVDQKQYQIGGAFTTQMTNRIFVFDPALEE